MRKEYTKQACENYIDKHVNEFKGEMTTLEEGCLGLGLIVLHGAIDKYIVIIKEKFLTSWTSTHVISRYRKMPKKYQLLIL